MKYYLLPKNMLKITETIIHTFCIIMCKYGLILSLKKTSFLGRQVCTFLNLMIIVSVAIPCQSSKIKDVIVLDVEIVECVSFTVHINFSRNMN